MHYLHDETRVKPRIAGLFLMPLRFVCAWILFSAGWRRVVLKPESLNPHSAAYEGIKLTHFLAHSFLVSKGLEYVIIHPEATLIFLWFFTILEMTLGIMLFIGCFTRLVSVILALLFINLMFTVGWMGTTCLDEWTVAALGIAGSVALLLAGSGPYSVDAWLHKHLHHFERHHWFGWMVSPELGFIHDYRHSKRYALIASILVLCFVMGMNQLYVGGVYGPFHNPAVLPKLELTANIDHEGVVALNVFRNQGPDTYGSFITNIQLLNAEKQVLINYPAQMLGALTPNDISNQYPVAVTANGHAIVVPLGAKALIILLPPKQMHLLPGNYIIKVVDVSGLHWETVAHLAPNAVKIGVKNLQQWHPVMPHACDKPAPL